MIVMNGVNNGGNNDSADEHYDTPWEFKNRAIAAALATSNKANSPPESPNLRMTSECTVQSTPASASNSLGSRSTEGRSGPNSSLSSSSASQQSSPSRNGCVDMAINAVPLFPAVNLEHQNQIHQQPRKRLSLDQQATTRGQFLLTTGSSVTPGTKKHGHSPAFVYKPKNELQQLAMGNRKVAQTTNYVAGAGSCSRARLSFATEFASGGSGPSPSSSGELSHVHAAISDPAAKHRHSPQQQHNSRRNFDQKHKSQQSSPNVVTMLISPPGTTLPSSSGQGPSLITITSNGTSAARRDHYPLVSVNPAIALKSPIFAHPMYPLPSNTTSNDPSGQGQWQRQHSASANANGTPLPKSKQGKDSGKQQPQLDAEGQIHERLDRVESETLLASKEVGTFLFRRRPVEGNLALSLRSTEGVLHIKLEFRDGCWVLGEGPRFTTIQSMVRAYRRTELPVRGAEHIRLGNQIRTTDLLKQSPVTKFCH